MSEDILQGRIEQIGLGHKEIKLPLDLVTIKETADLLMISNRKPNLWIFSIFNGYKQLGTIEICRPHDFKEGDNVIIYIENNKIIKVIKDE